MVTTRSLAYFLAGLRFHSLTGLCCCAGPWTSLPLPVLQPQHDGGESWDAYTTNAAPALVQEDGSVLLVYRGQQHHVSSLPRWAARFTPWLCVAGSNVTADAAIGLARAASWEGPYERLNGGRPLFSDHSEDPFIYW